MILEREKGTTLAFSIGTALPLETNLLIEKVVIKEIWFNIKTLFRNYIQAFPTGMYPQRKQMAEEFIEEVENIVSFCKEQGVAAQLYITADPSESARLFWTAKLKSPKTPKQRQYADYERIIISMATAKFKDDIKEFKFTINGPIDRVVHMLTSFPIDLLSQYKFGKLLLLESHTGTVKGPSEWITKITKDATRRHLPFNILTLIVLGDGPLNFYALRTTNRQDLLTLSNSGKWNPSTSMPKVKADALRWAGSSKDLFAHILSIRLP